MHKYNIFLIVLAGFLLFFGCGNFKVIRGNGEMVKERYNVSDFENIEIGGFYQVTLEKGNVENVVIECDDNLLDYITVRVRGNRLVISNEEQLRSRDGIKVHITYAYIESISSSGASTIVTNDRLTTDELEVDLSGAGVLDLNIKAQALNVDISGAGMVKLAGNAKDVRLRLSGAGNLKAFNLRSEVCSVDLSGIGAAQVYVTERLRANVSGIGGIKYRGNPRDVDKNISGLGKVSKDENDDDSVI